LIKTASCITMEEDSYMLDFIYNILVVGFFILNIKVILVNCKRETSIVTLKERILYELSSPFRENYIWKAYWRVYNTRYRSFCFMGIHYNEQYEDV